MKRPFLQSHEPKKSIVLHGAPMEKDHNMLYQLQNVGYFEADSQYYVRRQGLDAMLAIYTLSGRGYLEYRGNLYDILPGQIFIIDCDEFQAYGTSGARWEFFWIHFKGAESRSLVHSLLRIGGPVYQTEDQMAFFNELFIRAENPGRKSALLISEWIYSLLIHLMVQAGDSRQLTGAVEEALGFIEMHFSENITLDRIAEAAHVSKYHLTREFTRQMNQSPYAYLLNMRLNRAKMLLLSTDEPVSEIAEQCGFRNMSCFFRQFRQNQGCSPLRYRHEERISNPLSF